MINNSNSNSNNNNQSKIGTGSKVIPKTRRNSKLNSENNNNNNISSKNNNNNNNNNNGNGTLVFDTENGCVETIKIRELESHLASCQFKNQNCKFRVNGCKYENRLNKLQHEVKCQYEFVTCKNCKRDDIPKLYLQIHVFRECPKLKVKCPQCKGEGLIEREQLLLHIDLECSETIISCKYKDSGCNDTFKRSQLLNHLSKISHTIFMGNLIDKLMESNKRCNQLIDTQSFQLKELLKSNNEFREQLDSVKHKNKWTIENFSNKIAIRQVFSPIFNVGGNKFRFTVYPKGSNNTGYISIYLHLSDIETPVTSSFSITLINTDKTKNITHNLEHRYTKEEGFGLADVLESSKITRENGWLSNNGELTIEFTISLKYDLISR